MDLTEYMQELLADLERKANEITEESIKDLKTKFDQEMGRQNGAQTISGN